MRISKLIFPRQLSELLVFYDTGRIMADVMKQINGSAGMVEDSGLHRYARLVITFTYAASKEDKLPLIGLGWKF